MRDTDGVVLAIDFGGTKIAGCTCTPDGQRLSEDVVVTTSSLGADANFALGVDLGRRLVGGSPLLAVGACTFGIPKDDGVALSPAIPGWDALPVRRRLAQELGAPVAVATDVKVAAAAESRHGALAGCETAIYLNLGTGLAVAIVVGGTVLSGAHGASGEIGYALPRDTSGLGLDGTRGSNGHGSVILEDLVSGMGLARTLASLSGRHDEAGKGERTAADTALVADLFARAEDDTDLGAARVLDAFLDELGYHLANLAIALDPERIAVGGGMVRAWDRIEQPLRDMLDAHVPYPPDLVLGKYPFDASLRGAVDLGLGLLSHAAAT